MGPIRTLLSLMRYQADTYDQIHCVMQSKRLSKCKVGVGYEKRTWELISKETRVDRRDSPPDLSRGIYLMHSPGSPPG